MKNQIVLNIKKRAAELIVEEINKNGIAKVYNLQNCIEKVKKELNIDLKDNGQGYLVFVK